LVAASLAFERADLRINARLYTNGRAQMRVSSLAGCNEIASLRLAPIKFVRRDRSTEQLVEPDAIGVQHIALAVAGDFLDLAGKNHFLDAAAVNAFRFPDNPNILLI
jgi:hypothetical protein